MLHVTGIFKRSGACCLCLGCLRGVVRVVCVWNMYEEWCVLYVTGMLKRSGACFKRPVCFRGVVRVVCDWDI